MIDTVHLVAGLTAYLYRLFTIRLLDPIEYLRELAAQKDRDDCGGRFVRAQPVGVRRAGNRRFEQSVVFVNGHHHVDHECDELQVFPGCLTRSEQIDARIGPQRPVVMLTAAIDSLERLLVQQHTERVTARYLTHHGHQQQVVVIGQIGFFENRGHLELVRSHFVVSRLDRNAQLVTLVFEILHKGHHPRGDRPEVMVFELLVLGALVAHQRTSGQHQVGTCGPQSFVHEKILLFPTQIGVHFVHFRIEQAANLHRGFVHGLQSLEQRNLVVERLSCIGDENGRYAERRVDDESWRSSVPRTVPARFERVADTAARKRRGIGFLLDQQLTAEFLDHASPAVVLDKGIVFLGRPARERLKPMRVVCGPHVHSPLLHACCYAVSYLAA